MEKFTVEVTEKHIKKGTAKNTESCAVALAVRGLKLRAVEVDNTSVFFSKGGKRYEAILPKRAVNFVLKFDTGQKVKPFSFTLKPVGLVSTL
jgi:hypothetical protein